MYSWCLFVALLLVAGCSQSKPTVLLPNTPEAHACKDRCMQLYWTCMGSAEGVGKLVIKNECVRETEECGLACPGARRASDPTPSPTAAPPP